MRCELVLLLLLTVFATPSRAGLDAHRRERVAQDQEEPEDKRREVFWDNGLQFRYLWGNLRMKLGAQIQNDTAGFATGGEGIADDVELEDGVEWRRARLYLDGRFRTHWSFKFQWELAESDPPNLKDAFLQRRITPFGVSMFFRGGRFTSTFGLENDGGAPDTIFMEQGLTAAFLPPQETGFLIHSESTRRRWDIGFTSGATEFGCLICDVVGITGRYSTAVNLGSKDRTLHMGLNGSRRWATEDVVFKQRPESHIAPFFVDTGLLEAERVDVGLYEIAFLNGPFSVQSEGGFAVPKLSTGEKPLLTAFYVFASYALTGELRPHDESGGTIGRIRPARPFGDGAGAYGALEIAFRFSRIDLDDKGVSGGTMNDVTFGFNWYPTYPTRMTINVVRANREGFDPVWIFQFRAQLAF